MDAGGGIFGSSKEERELRKKASATALIHCAPEKSHLQQCFRTSWFGWCDKEQRNFWVCFSKASSL